MKTLSKTESSFVEAFYQLNAENETPVQVAQKHNRNDLARAMEQLKLDEERLHPDYPFLMEPQAKQWMKQQVDALSPPPENKWVPWFPSVHRQHLLEAQKELLRQYNPHQNSILSVASDPVLFRAFEANIDSNSASEIQYTDLLPSDFEPGQKIPDHPRGMSLLHQVALSINKPGMGELFNILMDYHPYTEQEMKDSDGYTPLHYLIMNSASSYVFTYLINSSVEPGRSVLLADLATFAQEIGETESLAVLEMFDTYIEPESDPYSSGRWNHNFCHPKIKSGKGNTSKSAKKLYQTLAAGSDPNQPVKVDNAYTTAVTQEICRLEHTFNSEEEGLYKDRIATFLLFGADILYLKSWTDQHRSGLEQSREIWMRMRPDIHSKELFGYDLINYRVKPSSRNENWHTSQYNLLFSQIRKVASEFQLAGGISNAHPVCTCLSLSSADLDFQPRCQKQIKGLREELADKLRSSCDKEGSIPLADGMAPFQLNMTE